MFISRVLAYCVFSLLLLQSIKAQVFERQYDIPLTVNGNVLTNPWAGGLNSCQISRIDANMDGKKDLFLFDRIGSRISIYLNMDDSPGAINYKYTLEFNDAFPSAMRNWVLLRDMNCDGKEDICTNSGSGFKIFWNTSVSELSFDLNPGLNITAFYDWGNSNLTSGVYCISPDLPAFNDYDNDGDIDIWSWNEFSVAEFFYKNMAVENGDCTTPDFVCRNRCYGMFGESTESFQLFTGTEFICDFNVAEPRSDGTIPMRHTGGTTLAVDLDQNGLKDLIIGDITENTLASVQMMEASNGQDSAYVVQYDFPATYSNTLQAEMPTFLAAFYEDINNDGINDLIVCPNAYSDAEDRKSLLLYINNGQNDLPDFEWIQNDFLQVDQMDLGNSAFPITFDVDNDGLLDLLVSNKKYFEFGNSYTSKISYYKNIGSATAPAFELMEDNWLDIPSHEWVSAFLTFGDLDNDLDADLIVGDQDGLLHYFMNLAAPGEASNFNLTVVNILNADGELLDVGQNAAPQLFDYDNDSKLDLIIGELNGNINYYKNTGTNEVYSFDLIEDTIGNVVATSILGIQGKSIPFMYRNPDGLTELLVGTETGQINYYTDIEGNELGTFQLVTNDYQNIHEGERSSPFLSDINADELPDLFLGNIGGGMGIYTHVPVGIQNLSQREKIQVYPNPALNDIWINIPEIIALPVRMEVLDGLGRSIDSFKFNSRMENVNLDGLSNGIYILRFLSNDFTSSIKLIVK